VIVIDASSLTKYVLHEENWEEVGLYIKERRPLYSVEHILKEVGNAIWKHCYLKRIIDENTAIKLYQVLLKLMEVKVVILEPEEIYLQEALQIALNQGITLYDSLYLVQAQKYGELLTSDKKQAEIAVKLGIKVHFIA